MLMINPKNLMIFTLSLITFEVGFIAIMVFIVYLSSFTSEIIKSVHWSVFLVFILLLTGIIALSYVQQNPKNIRTRFIIKSIV